MKNPSSLHCQHDQQLLDDRRGWIDEAKLELLCAGDHLPQQLVHSVGVRACAVRNASAKLRTQAIDTRGGLGIVIFEGAATSGGCTNYRLPVWPYP